MIPQRLTPVSLMEFERPLLGEGDARARLASAYRQRAHTFRAAAEGEICASMRDRNLHVASVYEALADKVIQ